MTSAVIEVYGLISSRDEGVRYVGATIQGRKKRFAAHSRASKSGIDREVYRWMRAEQLAGHVISVIQIEECPDLPTLLKREAYWIDTLPNLVNQYGGGGGIAMLSEDTRLRMSQSAKRRFQNPSERAKIWPTTRSHEVSEEVRQKLSAANRRRYEDPAERERTAQYSRGRKLSPAHREALVRANTGKRHSPETLTKLRAAKLGKPWRPGHVRWHVNRGITKLECVFCQEDMAK